MILSIISITVRMCAGAHSYGNWLILIEISYLLMIETKVDTFFNFGC